MSGSTINGVFYKNAWPRAAIAQAFPNAKYVVWLRSASDYSYEEYSVDGRSVVVYINY